MITLVVARARDGAIGRRKTIPWHSPEDLGLFQKETVGGAVIMGRNTWESLPSRPLPRRTNCVVSRDNSIADHVFPSVEEAVDFCYDAGHQRIYGIGGESIYEALLPRADRLLITEVDVDIPDADTWFPAFDESNWRESRRTVIRHDAPRCMLRELLRIHDRTDSAIPAQAGR